MAGQFHAVDYVVFFLVMAISLGIGVFQGFTGMFAQSSKNSALNHTYLSVFSRVKFVQL